jgi:LAO/AO transport system kinase
MLPDAGVTALLDGVLARQPRALGQAVSLFEDTRPAAVPRRQALLAALHARGIAPLAHLVGITGTPGAGKSSLIDVLITRLLHDQPSCTIAVLAVDPSSAQSGGSILGDRTRLVGSRDSSRVYFRSQASNLELGGLSRTTFSVCRLLERLFDVVFLETVGVGQNEIDVCRVAHHTLLVMPPLGGDHVQWMKAGIMEIPDLVVLNKCDQVDAARRSYHSLRSALALAQPGFDATPDIIQTSTLTGQGIPETLAWLKSRHPGADAGGRRERARLFFEKWVHDEYGRSGLRQLAHPLLQGVRALAADDFEAAQQAFATAYFTSFEK